MVAATSLIMGFVRLISAVGLSVFAMSIDDHRTDRNEHESVPHFEIIESNYLRSKQSGAHCGLYSFFVAACAINREPSINEVLSSKYLSSWKGSSVQNLIDLASDQGLVATPLFGIDVQTLRSSRFPIILLLSHSRQAEGTAHWVTFLGDDDGRPIVADSPFPARPMEYVDLLGQWTGIGVVIGNQPITTTDLLISRISIGRYFVFPTMFLLVAIVWIRWQKQITKNVFQIVAYERSPRTTAAQAIVLTSFAVGWCVTDNLTNSLSFWHNGDTVRALRCEIEVGQSSKIKHVSLEMAIEAKGIFVDCRMPEAYARGHIPDAIRLPIDASLSERREFVSAVRKFESNRALYVYCQSENCSWADTTAARLRCLGFPETYVIEGGFIAFQRTSVAAQETADGVIVNGASK